MHYTNRDYISYLLTGDQQIKLVNNITTNIIAQNIHSHYNHRELIVAINRRITVFSDKYSLEFGTGKEADQIIFMHQISIAKTDTVIVAEFDLFHEQPK